VFKSAQGSGITEQRAMQPGQSSRVRPYVKTFDEALSGAGAQTFTQCAIPDHAGESCAQCGYVPRWHQQAGLIGLNHLGPAVALS
jgi:hypothetical protein